MNEIIIALIALFCGWLGSMLKSYFLEKGKNLATKEDIAEITEKVEFVKNQFSQRHIRSKSYIEKQIKAYGEIDVLLYDFICLYFSDKNEPDKFDTLKSIIASSSVRMMKLNEKHSIYISEDIDALTQGFVELCMKFGRLNRLSTLSDKDTSKRSLSSPLFYKKDLDAIYDQALALRKQLKQELTEG